MDKTDTNEIPLMDVGNDNIVLFHPHIPKNAHSEVGKVLNTRWIGQGPKVEEFERHFAEKFCDGNAAIAVGSGTDALHLAYLLADIKQGDEVIVPVFTCTATNIPLLYIGAKIVFADIDPESMNISVDHLKKIISKKTKAIVIVHYAGLPCDMDEILNIAKQFGVKVIEDAAHAVGAVYKDKKIGTISDFTIFSFQAIKHITTGDGGLLTFRDASLLEKAKRLRWFGIDRKSKQLGIWENDIVDIGYKYQMTDLSAALGIASMMEIDETLELRKNLLERYFANLKNNSKIELIGSKKSSSVHAAWLCTVFVENRKSLQKKLQNNSIESNQVHYRNDRYSIFGSKRTNLKNMDYAEERYLCLPLHTKMVASDVDRVCDVINDGW